MKPFHYFRRHFYPALAVLLALILGIPTLSGCTKKKEVNTGYESESGSQASSQGSGQDSGGTGYRESDLEGGSSSTGKGGTSGLETVYFDFDSSSLTQEAKNALKNNASYLKTNQGMNLTVEGHCDERGSTEYNLALGERRANSVRDYIVGLGVTQKRLRTISYGEERPAVKGESESAWAKNRRADFSGR